MSRSTVASRPRSYNITTKISFTQFTLNWSILDYLARSSAYLNLEPASSFANLDFSTSTFNAHPLHTILQLLRTHYRNRKSQKYKTLTSLKMSDTTFPNLIAPEPSLTPEAASGSDVKVSGAHQPLPSSLSSQTRTHFIMISSAFCWDLLRNSPSTLTRLLHGDPLSPRGNIIFTFIPHPSSSLALYFLLCFSFTLPQIRSRVILAKYLTCISHPVQR